jgi:sugar phosphate permease
MQRLKAWWAGLNWWKKTLLVIPAAIVALIGFIAALWSRARPSTVRLPPVTTPPTKGAETVEIKVDTVIEGINEEIAAAKEKAKDAEEQIKKADSFAAVDAVLYGERKDGKRD